MIGHGNTRKAQKNLIFIIKGLVLEQKISTDSAE